MPDTGLLVVFGAGASFDSLPQLPVPALDLLESDRPPLTDQLFNREDFLKVADIYPDCNAIVPYLTKKGGVPVEEQLSQLQTEADGGHGEQRRRQLTAIQYYLQRVLFDCSERWFQRSHGVSAYRTLIDQVQYWQASTHQRAVFVTFNYDTLLEKALLDIGFTVPDMDSYTNRDDLWLVKAHGSVSWGRLTAEPQALTGSGPIEKQRELIAMMGRGLKLSDEYVHIGGPNEFEVAGRTVVPSVAIPVQSAKLFACPSKHIDQLRSVLSTVHHVVTIGWRGNERHFTEILRNGVTYAASWHIVSGSPAGAEETQQNLEGSGVPGSRWELSSGGFSSWVQSRALDDFALDRRR